MHMMTKSAQRQHRNSTPAHRIDAQSVSTVGRSSPKCVNSSSPMKSSSPVRQKLLPSSSKAPAQSTALPSFKHQPRAPSMPPPLRSMASPQHADTSVSTPKGGRGRSRRCILPGRRPGALLQSSAHTFQSNRAGLRLVPAHTAHFLVQDSSCALSQHPLA
eukprot:47296-Chlamydomonas_euryale.AAC.2